MTTSDIYKHGLASDSAGPVIGRVLQHLRRPEYFETPNGLALYRRLQFGRFLESSYLFTNRNLDETTTALHAATQTDLDQDGKPWFYAFVDRGCRPETEVWLFGSWEAVVRRVPASKDDGTSTNGYHVQEYGMDSKQQQQDDKAVQALLLDFIRSIRNYGLPPSIHNPEDVLAAQAEIAGSAGHSKKQHEREEEEEDGKPAPTTNDNPLENTHVMLWGAISAPTTRHLQALSLLATHLLPAVPNHTFLFALASLPKEPEELPPTLRWGKLQPRHFPLVRSRTEIARQDFTLARLPGLGIFPTEPEDAAPVAWAFVGLDGSLTTLHTEASHRRMGLGKKLSAKLFREEMGRFWEEGVERVAHGNVIVGNRASAGMCMSLGGRDVGEVYWLRVDLEKV